MTAWTDKDLGFKASPAQNRPIWRFEGQDGEDRPTIHPPHAGAVTHEAQENSYNFRPKMWAVIRDGSAMSVGVRILKVLS